MMPDWQDAITSSGPETRNMGAAITGIFSRLRIDTGSGMEHLSEGTNGVSDRTHFSSSVNRYYGQKFQIFPGRNQGSAARGR